MHQQGKVCVKTLPTFVTVIILFLMPKFMSLEIARMVEQFATRVTGVSLTIMELRVIGQCSLGGKLLPTDAAVDLLLRTIECFFTTWHLDLHIVEGLQMVFPGPNACHYLATELALNGVMCFLVLLQLLSCGAHLHAELAKVDDVWPLAVLALGPQLLAILRVFWLPFDLPLALRLRQGLGFA